jgi:lysophospholipase L1-like esterase
MASAPLRWALQGGMLALSVALALLLGEGLARLVLYPGDYLRAKTVSDSILGRRLEPGASGHDQWGFRNRDVPHRADVVTIGDSQTYGIGVPRRSSWPAQLSELTGRQVYNAALGGYSPIQYYELLRRYALRLKPSAVVVGFYFGNDPREAYASVYALSHYAGLRRQGVPPLRSHVPAPSYKSRPLSRVRNWLSRHSVLYGATLLSILPGRAQRAELIIRQTANDMVRFHHDTSSTVFTPAFRLRALDLDSPRVMEGLRLSLVHFQLMARLCDSAGVAFYIALIPTKERVYQSLIDADPELQQHALLREVLAQEGDVDQRVRRFLQEGGISYIDLLPPLQDAVRHMPIYPPHEDGHPNAAGYSVIARTVGRAIAQHLNPTPAPR